MKNNRILVLGADGFLGSSLVISLLKEKKYQIRAFDLFKDGVSQNLESVRKKIELFQGNFLNKTDLEKALKNIDYVFHFISLTNPGSSMNDPLVDIETNLIGTINLLEACAKAGVKRIIYPSSGGAIYGNQKKDRYSEEDPLQPFSPYAITKMTIEKYLEYYRITKKLDYLVLRISNPYGPRQNIVGNQGIIPIFLNLVKKNQPITVFGNGENIRDYLFIDDTIAHIKNLSFKENSHRVYNLGSGEGASINEIISIIQKVTKKKIRIEKKPSRSSDVKSIVLDTKRLEKEINCGNNINLKTGIEKTWNWIKKI